MIPRTLPLLMLAVTAAAQSPTVPAPTAPAPTVLAEKAQPLPRNVVGGPPGALQPWREVVHDTAADGSLYAAAPSYKAEFRTSGVRFTPFLGSDLPTNLPLELHLDEVQLAGQSLAVPAVAPQRDGNRITFERGTFRECYEVAPSGLEQTFRFDELPARGELTFAIHAATELAMHADRGGLSFRHERGHVTYTQAIAIDARGRRLPLPTTCTDGVIRFAVPASFVEMATLPLVVDPLIGTVYQGPTLNYQISGKDLAYDASSDEWHVAWSYPFSQTDSDLLVQRFTGNFVPIGSPIAIDLSGDAWIAPSIANLALYDRFLVVARKWVNGSYRIGARITAAGTTTPATAQFEIEGPTAAGNLGQPAYGCDVGGDPSLLGPTYWTVAFESDNGNDSDIYLRQVTNTGTLRGAAPTVVANSALEEIQPRISKSNGQGNFATQAWGIAYNFDYSQIHGRSVTWNGTLVGPQNAIVLGITSHSDFDISSPTDEFQGGRQMLLAYESPDLAQTSQDVLGLLINRTMIPASYPVSLTALALPPLSNAHNQSNPSVDCDGMRFVLGFTHLFGGTDHDIVAAVFHREPSLPTGLTCVQTDSIAQAFEHEDHAKICAATTGAGDRLRYGFTWEHSLTATTQALEAVGYEGRQDGAQVTVRPTGCGGMQIGYSGRPLAGETFTAFVPNAQGLSGLVAGFPVNNPIPGCNGCLQGVQGFTLIGSQVQVQIPFAGSFVGMTMSFQAFDLGSGPCLAQVRLSDTMDATIR